MQKKENILRYYEAEMRYLEEAGNAFAKAHPDSAKYLNMADSLERDPMVERLFEGFAFLSAKLYQKIDDEMPELTESILGLLWPHYLKAIPSLGIVQLVLNNQINTNFQKIPKGLVLQTIIDPTTNIVCEYQTTLAVDVLPIEVVQANLAHNELGQSIIQIGLQLKNIEYSNNIQLPDEFSLKIYLSGENSTRLMLYHALINQLSHLSTDPDFMKKTTEISINRVHFEEESVSWLLDDLPSDHSLLMEYFLFRDKFLFIEFKGLRKQDFDNDKHQLLINCHLKYDFPLELPFDHSYFKLFCVPAINIFKLEAEPITKSQLQNEYKLIPMHQEQQYIDIFSVESVTSYNQKSGIRKKYLPFHQFKHHNHNLNIADQTSSYFYTRTKEGVAKKHETYITFSDNQVQVETNADEILSISLLATNGNFARQIVKHNKKLDMLSPLLGIKHAEMVTIPTPVSSPPNYQYQQWQLLFEMGQNYLSTLDLSTFKNSLRLLNWSSSTLNNRNIEAITALNSQIEYIMHQGAMIRCLIIDLDLDISGFINEADAVLFAYMINVFFQSYTQINLATKINMIIQPAGTVYTWPINFGECNI